MLKLRSITKDYKSGDTVVHALKGVDISFRKSEFVSILGPSGCGKTTLLNIIGGLDHYTDGELYIDNISTKNYNDRDWDTYRNHRIGFIFQSYNLIPHQTISENVELALTISGVSKAERIKRAHDALDRVGLAGLYGKKPNQLSGGQCQRVAIARALVNEPEILLADEPTGALDTVTSVQIMDLIQEIAKECLVIMVTHNPELAEKYRNYMSGYDFDYTELFSKFDFSAPEAMRASSGKILNEIAKNIPNLLSGSADLAPSTLTKLKCSDAFSPENRSGRNIQFGIREHAMAAIANGIQLHGGLRILCSTFFSFSDYMKGAIRLSGLLNVPVIYVMTHDSIGVGEDGPTHQPMEQLIALRSIPNVKVFRPCDGKETLAAYISALTGQSPTVLVLSRQAVNQHKGSGIKAVTGGYVLDDCNGTPDVLVIGTGSEIDSCIGAKEILTGEGLNVCVVSMPCLEEFENQTKEYKESVLPKSVKARVCVEAASHYAWYKYCRDYGEVIAMHSFGCSAPANDLFRHFGFTSENVAEKAKLSIEKVNADEDNGGKKKRK